MAEEGVAKAIRSRRSVRDFEAGAVDEAIVRELVTLACLAPAPHHSRPWRFVDIRSTAARERLAEAMAAAWRKDARRDGMALRGLEAAVQKSNGQLLEAPVLLLACLSLESARDWPDAGRRAAEREMFVQSLGAALQNLLLAAVEAGLSGFIKGAPLFCRPAASEALGLPSSWEPEFLVLLGYAKPGSEPGPRAPLDLSELLTDR